MIDAFQENPGYKESRAEMFSKFAFKNLEDIMPKLGPYLDYPVTDSIVAEVAKKYPNQVLTYATSYTPTAAAIRRNQDPWCSRDRCHRPQLAVYQTDGFHRPTDGRLRHHPRTGKESGKR